MITVIGEILFDELPEGRRPGGAPFNLAQHLGRMGGAVRFVSRVGTDTSGDALIRTMDELGMDTRAVQRDPLHATGRVEVTLSGKGIPSYTIIENVAYDHIDFETLEIGSESCQMVCFGSLIQRTEVGRQRLIAALSALPAHVLRLYDMNLRPGCDAAEVVLPSLEQTDILKINDEELERTGQMLNCSLQGDELVRLIMKRFGIQTVALTAGPEGSGLYSESGRFAAPASPLEEGALVDTVGAGDSFTAVLAWGILNGWHPDDLLKRANLLAGRMCTVQGAVPESDDIYQGVK